MRRHTWCLFPVLVLLSACNREPEAADTIEKYRPTVEARLAAVQKIGENLKTMPPLSGDGATLDSGPLQLGTGTDAPLATDNAILETAARLAGDLGADPGDGAGTHDLWWCAKLIGDKYYAERSSVSNAEAYLGHCVTAKYLLAVRILKSIYPEVDEGQGTFRPGSMAGEVRVFNLGSGKDLGGFRFEAQNSDLVTNRDGRGRDYTSVASDLESQVRSQIRAGVAEHLGGGGSSAPAATSPAER